MSSLSTDRLVLLPLTTEMIGRRLETDDFALDCDLPDGVATVRFGPQWPGETGMLPGLLRAAGPDGVVDLTYAVVDPRASEAVGMMGTKGPADGDGVVDIGYGLNESVWGRGFATEAVGAMLAEILTRPGVVAVTAETAVTNIASQKVLRHNGFRRTGQRWSDEDGELFTWELRPARPPAG